MRTLLSIVCNTPRATRSFLLRVWCIYIYDTSNDTNDQLQHHGRLLAYRHAINVLLQCDQDNDTVSDINPSAFHTVHIRSNIPMIDYWLDLLNKVLAKYCYLTCEMCEQVITRGKRNNNVLPLSVTNASEVIVSVDSHVDIFFAAHHQYKHNLPRYQWLCSRGSRCFAANAL